MNSHHLTQHRFILGRHLYIFFIHYPRFNGFQLLVDEQHGLIGVQNMLLQVDVTREEGGGGGLSFCSGVCGASSVVAFCAVAQHGSSIRGRTDACWTGKATGKSAAAAAACETVGRGERSCVHVASVVMMMML